MDQTESFLASLRHDTIAPLVAGNRPAWVWSIDGERILFANAAGAAMFGSFVITLDPIFSGLAWSFIFGIFASTAFSLLVVPVVYFMIHRTDAEVVNHEP